MPDTSGLMDGFAEFAVEMGWDEALHDRARQLAQLRAMRRMEPWTPDEWKAWTGRVRRVERCREECRAVLLEGFAKMGVEATVTLLPPLVVSPYEQLGLKCKHGTQWYAEPTSEQIAAWAEAGVQ